MTMMMRGGSEVLERWLQQQQQQQQQQQEQYDADATTISVIDATTTTTNNEEENPTIFLAVLGIVVFLIISLCVYMTCFGGLHQLQQEHLSSDDQYRQTMLQRQELAKAKKTEDPTHRKRRLVRYFQRCQCHMTVKANDLIDSATEHPGEEEEETIRIVETTEQPTIMIHKYGSSSHGTTACSSSSDEEEDVEAGLSSKLTEVDNKNYVDDDDVIDDDDHDHDETQSDLQVEVENVTNSTNDDTTLQKNDDDNSQNNNDDNTSQNEEEEEEEEDDDDDWNDGYLILRYKKQSKATQQQQQQQQQQQVRNCCAICLGSYAINDTVVWSSSTSRKCKHAFHQDCVVDWLCKMQTGTPCPICRQTFLPDFPEYNNGKLIKPRNLVPPQRTFSLGVISLSR